MLAELQQLRAEIAAAAWRIAADDTSLATLPREIQDRLFQTTDAVVRAAADAWVTTRFGLGPSDPS